MRSCGLNNGRRLDVVQALCTRMQWATNPIIRNFELMVWQNIARLERPSCLHMALQTPLVILISEFLERHSEVKHTRTPAYSRALPYRQRVAFSVGACDSYLEATV